MAHNLSEKMGHAEPVARFTHDDFLEWEAKQSTKHEFLRGEVFAMVGARRVHVEVTGNVFALLKSHLKGTACRPYASEMLVRVADADADFYPDVLVTCDEKDKTAERVLTAPTLIAEVLSEGTEAFDRGGKFEAYRHIKTLKEYVLIDPDQSKVECFRLNKDGHWELHEFAPNSAVTFASMDFETPWSEIFAEL